jgi:hypothetical protein
MHFAILSARYRGNMPWHCANHRIIRKTLN